MSSIGKIELGSKNGAYKSAVAFFLSTAPKNDYQMKIEFMNIKWHFILNKRNLTGKNDNIFQHKANSTRQLNRIIRGKRRSCTTPN